MVMNIFKHPGTLKRWSLDLSDACGSVITNQAPDIKKIDTLVEQFVTDYNENMELVANATKEKTS